MVRIDLQKIYGATTKLIESEEKNLPKIVQEAEQQAESKVWQYLSSQGNTNAALITKPSISTTGKALKKYEAPVVKEVKKAEKEAASVVKRATLTSTKDLTPIQSKEEYLEVLERIKKAKTKSGDPLWLCEEDMKFYPNATEIEQGLLPYCGHRDISNQINRYLSGRSEPTAELQDVVRAMDYSLAHLDKDAGRYEGIVFRQGFMGEKTGQFMSTSTSATGAARHNNGWADPEEVAYNTYSVIKTKGGHRLSAFQGKMKDVFAGKEQEILLPREATYREVPLEECSEELIKAKEEFASKLFNDAYKLFNGSKSKVRGYTKEDLLNLVKVYEEI
ncbi:MAG: hypothetical protein K6E29_05025 [Cyanobacteria bacterium RUI128]|nr:hypothetical protein [Cyanobacteria bacterium RUI128]